MSAAIAGLLAALAVVFKLSITTTSTPPIETYLSVLLNFFSNQPRVLVTDEAITVLMFSIVTYMVVFSVAFFVLRTLAIFAVAFGVPDEDHIRLNRAMRRNRSTEIVAMRRQARLNALYTVRAQQAALAAERRRQAVAEAQRKKTGPLPPLDPTPADFGLTQRR